MNKSLYMRTAIVILVWFFCNGCLEKKSIPADSNLFLPSKMLAELTEKKLKEVSGLAASAVNPGLLWAINDSGNPAVVYLVDEELSIRLMCRLEGVKNRDWEDVAVGPGPDEGKRYVYVADIGDNNGRYQTKYIYRFEEPSASDHAAEITVSSFDTIAFRLAGETKDTESIIVHPRTRDIYIISKREKPVHVYELKWPFEGENLTAQSIASLPLTQIVAADISADGEEVLMKNYDNVYYWALKGKSLAEGLKERPAVLLYTEEPQGEAITFNLDGSGFYTLSEKIKDEKTFLYFYQRR